MCGALKTTVIHHSNPIIKESHNINYSEATNRKFTQEGTRDCTPENMCGAIKATVIHHPNPIIKEFH